MPLPDLPEVKYHSPAPVCFLRSLKFLFYIKSPIYPGFLNPIIAKTSYTVPVRCKIWRGLSPDDSPLLPSPDSVRFSYKYLLFFLTETHFPSSSRRLLHTDNCLPKTLLPCFVYLNIPVHESVASSLPVPQKVHTPFCSDQHDYNRQSRF